MLPVLQHDSHIILPLVSLFSPAKEPTIPPPARPIEPDEEHPIKVRLAPASEPAELPTIPPPPSPIEPSEEQFTM